MSLVFDVPFALPSSGVDPLSFRHAMACLPAPVAVITTLTADRTPTGATLSAVSSLSLDPPLFLACFDHRSDTLRAIRAERRFLVHVIAGGQSDIAMRFASKSPDKFGEIAWRSTPAGLPVIDDCRLVMQCRLFSTLPGGDHAIIVGEVQEIVETRDVPAMVYADRRMTVPVQETQAG